MEFIVHQQYRNGKLLSPHQRHAASSRGELRVDVAKEEESSRPVLVATVSPSKGGRVIEPIHDVALVSISSDFVTLRGYEWVIGRAGTRHAVVQEWRCEYAVCEDLRHAETQWGQLAGRVEELQRQLAARA